MFNLFKKKIKDDEYYNNEFSRKTFIINRDYSFHKDLYALLDKQFKWLFIDEIKMDLSDFLNPLEFDFVYLLLTYEKPLKTLLDNVKKGNKDKIRVDKLNLKTAYNNSFIVSLECEKKEDDVKKEIFLKIFVYNFKKENEKILFDEYKYLCVISYKVLL